MQDAETRPQDMRWRDVDPARHPFAWDGAEPARVAALITARATGGTAAVVPGTGATHQDLLVWVAELFTERYGPWTAGWEWSVHDAGPVDCWCCPPDPLPGTVDGTAGQAVASLLQWRGWLEQLAETFRDLAPPPGASRDVRSRHIERAVARLVTAVVDRTQCEENWYALVGTTLRWYFEACGHTPEDARAAAETAQDGRFRSWVRPHEREVRDYAESLATEAAGAAPSDDR